MSARGRPRGLARREQAQTCGPNPGRDGRVGPERWLLSYADVVTLLFAFFVVLYAARLQKPLPLAPLQESPAASAAGLFTQGWQLPLSPAAASAHSPSWRMPLPAAALASHRLDGPLAAWLAASGATISHRGEWLDIALDANWLFDSASATPSGEARDLMRLLAERLAQRQGDIWVMGYTDDQPIRTAQFASNWALSAARAVAVVEALKSAGVAPERLSAVGMGEHHPVASNATAEGRALNRRVVVRIRLAAPSGG